MDKMTKTVIAALKSSSDGNYIVHEGKDGCHEDIIEFSVEGKNCRFTTYIICDTKFEVLDYKYSLYQMVPEERRDEVAKWMANTNYFTKLGAFGLDMEDGDILFRAASVLSGKAINKKLVIAKLCIMNEFLDDIYPELMRVIFPQDEKKTKATGNAADLLAELAMRNVASSLKASASWTELPKKQYKS